jgi:electron transfer flavoprotein alpha subunit
MTSLVIAEHDNNHLFHSTLNTLYAATQISEATSVLVVGSGCRQVAEEVAGYEGVSSVLLADHPVYQHLLAENTAKLVAELALDYSHLLAPADTFGKNLLPRVAGLLNLGQISDIVKVIDKQTFERPIYAGNAIARVESLDAIKILTVRSTAFSKVATSAQPAAIATIDKVIENKQSRFVRRQFTATDRPELTAAKIVVAGGRGLQNADNFKLLEALATQLGAALGASRAAVDAGFVPNDYQVGQTGKVVAPDLYIALGISGAIQHVAGMKDSKVVVAINKDPDAAIFAVADYGLVADLFKVLPELMQELAKLGYKLR